MKLLNDETLCDYVNRPDPLLVKGLKHRRGSTKIRPFSHLPEFQLRAF
jgi:hypothetical protein